LSRKPGQFDPAAGLVEDAVKRELDRGDRLRITGPDGDRHRVVDAIQLVDLEVADAVGGRGGQFPGDGGLQPENVLDVLPGQRQHDMAAVRLQLHHALAAQLQ